MIDFVMNVRKKCKCSFFNHYLVYHAHLLLFQNYRDQILHFISFYELNMFFSNMICFKNNKSVYVLLNKFNTFRVQIALAYRCRGITSPWFLCIRNTLCHFKRLWKSQLRTRLFYLNSEESLKNVNSGRWKICSCP